MWCCPSSAVHPWNPFPGSETSCYFTALFWFTSVLHSSCMSKFIYCLKSIAQMVLIHWTQKRQRLPGYLGCSLLHIPSCVCDKTSPFYMCPEQSGCLKKIIKVSAFCWAKAPAVFKKPFVHWPNLSLFYCIGKNAFLSWKSILWLVLKFGYWNEILMTF